MADKNFINNPSKATLIFVTIFAVIGWLMLIYASIDEIGKPSNFSLLFVMLILSNILILINLYRNYFKNKKQNSNL